MEILFWALIALVFYTYLGYGMVLLFLIKIKRLFIKPKEDTTFFQPEVSLVIPAYNEAEFILEKLKNTLEIDYPKDKLHIIFITDGSTDNTPDLLKEVEGITLLHSDRRAGKSAAENRAMQHVKTPFVIFCDANTRLNTDCVSEIVKHYKNPKIGGVSGEKKIVSHISDTASGAGEGLYWKYESTLKKWDFELYSIVGAAGELVSFRTALVEDLEEDTILDDFVQSLRICAKGYRFAYEPKAYALETGSDNVKEELKRKVRIAAGGWQSMARLKALLNPFKHGILSFQYISHRVLRWSLSAFALPIILMLNFYLVFTSHNQWYDVIAVLQLIFYIAAISGWMLANKAIKVKVLFVPYYFLMMNYAVFAGFKRWILKSQAATWERAKRAQ